MTETNADALRPAPRAWAPAEHVAAYRGVMDRVLALVDTLDERTERRTVPATPDWSVHDLLAHLVGVTSDALAGNLKEAGSDPWTARHVEDRRDRTVAEIMAEWEGNWPAFSVSLQLLAEQKPFRSGQAIFDATTHEHDLRGALDQPGGRDAEAFDLSWEWAANIVGQMRDGFQVGALALRTEEGERVVGGGEVTGAVAASRFELWRAMTGRRSTAQVLAFGWEGEPSLGTLCFFRCRSTDLVE